MHISTYMSVVQRNNYSAALFDGSLAFLMKGYPPALRWALRSKGLIVVLATAAFAASLLVVPWLGVDLVPAFSQGEFSYLIELPEGTPLEATDRFAAGIQTVLEGDPRVEFYSSITGGAGLALTRTGTEGESTARIQVRMKPGTGRGDEEQVAALLRARLEKESRARFKFERPSYFSFRTPVEVEIYSDSLADLQTASSAIRQGVSGLKGFVDVKSSMEVGNPELQITFNREQLVNLGLDLAQVASTVRNKVQGEVATRFQQGDREIDILVRTLEAGVATVADINDIIVAQRAGVPIRLKSIAQVKLEQGPSEIRRIGQNRAAVVSANLSGRDMGSASTEVRNLLASTPIPVGALAALSGQEEELQRSFTSLLLALGLAIFLVYMVMACEFESIIHPLVVMFTVPLGAIGMILALAVTGNTINVVAIIGGLLLAGIVVDNAIVLIDAVNQFRERGMSREDALLAGGMERMRPILMTSACTVLGLLPMAVGIGAGAELQAPLAITVIGGLTIGTILTLIVIPVVYILMDRKVYAAVPQAEMTQVAAVPEAPAPDLAFPGAVEAAP